MTHPRVLLRTASWIGALLAALVGLGAAGDRLPAPPWPAPDPSAAWDWLHRTDPTLATFSILRLAAIAVVGYLLLSTVVLLATRLVRIPGFAAVAARATLPATRRLVHHATGFGLAVALAGTAGPAVAEATPVSHRPAATAAPFASRHPDPTPGPAPTTAVVPSADASPTATSAPVLRALPDDPTLVHLGPTPSTATAPSPAGIPTAADTTTAATTATTSVAESPPNDDPASTATTTPERPAPATTAAAPPVGRDGRERTDDGADGQDGTDRQVGTDGPDGGAPGPRPAPGPMVAVPGPTPPTTGSTDDRLDALAAVDRRHHTIVSGDHLWGVAERTLFDRTGAPPAPGEVLGYLDRLVAENRAVLAVPDNPDLVFPGQVFVLPE